MATSANYFCSLCQEDDETTLAVTWCAECEVFLCPECQRHHGRSKTSKHHQIMSVQNYQQLPDFMLKVKNNCEDHDLRYELFCSFHDAACCIKCIKDKHDNCKGLVPLGEVVGSIKSSAHVIAVEKDLSDLLENLNTIKNFFSENLESLQKQKVEAIGKVHNMRQSINEHLDKLEKCLFNDIESEFSKTRDKIERLKSEIVDKTDQIEEIQKEFSKIVKFSTDLQTYFGLHEFEKITKQEEKYINNLKSADNLREKKVKVDFQFDLESKFRQLTTLGKVTTYLLPDYLQLKTKGEGQVQTPQSPLLGQIHATFKHSFEMPKHSMQIKGCQILTNGEVVFIDENSKCLLLFSHAGVFLREAVTFQNPPNDICSVRQNEVAVTTNKDHMVHLVDVERNKIVKQTVVGGRCYGICIDEQTIYVRVLPKTIIMFDFDFNVKNRIEILGEYLTRIAVFRDNLYCTNWDTNTVSCYSIGGEMLWSYNHDIIDPLGIDVDKNGFVYVACRGSNNIIALSQDGKELKVIMSTEHGVKCPSSININRELSLLVFSNRNDKSFLLSI